MPLAMYVMEGDLSAVKDDLLVVETNICRKRQIYALKDEFVL